MHVGNFTIVQVFQSDRDASQKRTISEYNHVTAWIGFISNRLRLVKIELYRINTVHPSYLYQIFGLFIYPPSTNQ
jgi:hypothetical protein